MEIINMFKESLTLKDYVDLFDKWNVDRCADGAENSFDLDDFGDYSLFNNLYGLETTFKCMKLQRFWIGGTNFTEPKAFPTTIEDAKVFLSNMFDIDIISHRKDIYGKYFNIDFIDFYAPNNNHMQHGLIYPVVLQYFTTYWWGFVLWAKHNFSHRDGEWPFRVDVSKNDILDMVANIAYNFYTEYQYTEWETSFDDYALHYIVRLLKEKNDIFADILIHNDIVYDSVVNYFKTQVGEYYTEYDFE